MFINFLRKKGCKLLNSQKITDFIYSPFFTAYLAIMSLIAYTMESPFVSLAIIAAIACFILLRSSDVTPIITLFFFALIQIRNIEDMAAKPAIIIFSIVAVFLILHFIFYPPKKFLKLKLTLPLILVSVAYFLGGFFAPQMSEPKRNFLLASANGPLLLFIYFFFANYLNPPKSVDIKKYFCTVLVVLGIAMTAQMFIHKLYFFKYLKEKYSIDSFVGIANVNGYAAMLMLCVFSCFYLMAKTNHIIKNFVALVILYIGLIYSECYGGIGVTLFFAPVAAYYTVRYQTPRNKKRLNYTYFLILLLLIFAISVIFAKNGFIQTFNTLSSKLSDDHGRTPLFIEAINLFVKHPVFGVGCGYYPPDKNFETIMFGYNLHSIFFHTLAMLGIFGVIAYSYFYLARYKMILKINDCFNVFSYIAFSAFFAYSMIDTCENTVIPCTVFAIIFMIIVEYANSNYKQPLPLNGKVEYKKQS